MEKLWVKLFNRETISYLFFGVLTTLVDWVSYWVMRKLEIDYRVATAGSWAAAVAFAYITNKLFVFSSKDMHWSVVKKELISFVGCRAATGLFTVAAMMVLVDGLGIQNDFICKVVLSGISLVLNYVFSKWFIFKGKITQGSK